MNDELKIKKEKERTTLFQTSVVLGTSLSLIQTSHCFVDPPRSGARPCVVLDFKHAVVLGTCVYKNQRPGKNGRKIFRPYNFNRFIRYSGDFNFSVKDVRI